MDGYTYMVWIFVIVQTGNVNPCYVKFTTRTGVILSPNYPDDYGINLHCTWEIHPDNGGRIVLSFHDFRLEYDRGCDNDYLMVYDGGINEEQILLDKKCRRSMQKKTVISSSDKIFIVFKTDDSVGYRGFNITWDACGGTFIGQEGFVTSPKIRYNFYTKHDYVCSFKLKIPETRTAVQVNLSASVFGTDDCLIQIQELHDTSTCIDTYSHIYVSNTNEVNLTFKLVEVSDAVLKASYSKYDCTREIRNVSGVIQSPGYWDHFDRDSVCDYVMNFSLSDRQLIELILNEIDISCSGSDALEILQYDSDDNIHTVALCKDNVNDTLYVGDNIVLRLISKYDKESVRFSIRYSIIEATVILSVKENSLAPGIVGGITGALVVIVVGIIVFILYKKRRNQSGKPQITRVNNTTVNNRTVNSAEDKADIGDRRVNIDYEDPILPTYSLSTYSHIAPTMDQSASTDRDSIYKVTEEDEYDNLHTSRPKISPGKGHNLYDVPVKDDNQYDTTQHFESPNMDDDNYMSNSAKQTRDKEDNVYDKAHNSVW